MVAAVSGERSLRLPGAGAPRFERTASEATMHAAANDRPPPKWEIDHAVRSWLGSLVSRCLELTLMLKRRIPGRPATWLAYSRKSKIWKKLDALTAQVNKSIKSGQNVTLHTQNGRPGGCLTYRGLSGEQGGIVSWNAANCSRDVLWTID